MERGKMDIHFSECTQELSVHIRLSEDGTVWLTKYEIADLFDVYIQTVTSGLKTIFQRGELFEMQVTKIHCFTNAQGRQCSVELYNLDMIISLSFYMKGGICQAFRERVYQMIRQPMKTAVPRPPILNQLNQTSFFP